MPDSDNEDDDHDDSVVSGDFTAPDLAASNDARPHVLSFTKALTSTEDDNLQNLHGSGEIRASGNPKGASHASSSHTETELAKFSNLTDIDDIGNVLASVPKNNGADASSIAARLEAEIRKGLETIQDVLRISPSSLESDNDSPLSSVPSSALSSPRHSASKNRHRNDLGSSPAGLGNGSLSPQDSTPPSAGATLQQGPYPIPPVLIVQGPQTAVEVSNVADSIRTEEVFRRRSLRPRAAIQLHPYALEDAKYRQTWTASGLKPVRVPEVATRPEDASKEDSQGASAYESSQANPPDDYAQDLISPKDVRNDGSSIIADEESQSPRRGTRHRHSSPGLLDYDNLSDLPDFNIQSAPSSILKRKKASRRPLLKMDPGGDGLELYDLPDYEPSARKSNNARRQISSALLSPPRSRGGLSSEDGPAAENHTPSFLPTPFVSSGIGTSKRTFAALLDVSDSENDVISLSDDEAPPSSPRDTTDLEPQGMQHLRRRIRGVLPASWVKLDLKQREKPHSSRQQILSPAKSALEKGVAKHVFSTVRRPRDAVVADALDLDVSYSSISSEERLSPCCCRREG